MNLIPWQYPCSAGFILRGWRSEPSGKPILHFLHGNGFCGLTYSPMLALLSQDFDLWLCDVQGHGDSESGPKFLGWNKNAELVSEAFQALNPNPQVPVYAVGHSLGGVLSSLIMAQQPQLFSKAVLLDPVFFTPNMVYAMHAMRLVGLADKHPMAKHAAKRRDTWPNKQAAFAGLQPRGVFKVWTDEALWSYVNHGLHEIQGGVTLKCRPRREADFFGSFPRRLWSSLFSTQAPVLVLYAEQTFPFVAQSIKRWSKRNANVASAQVAGDHCFMQQYPESSANHIKQFLLADALPAQLAS